MGLDPELSRHGASATSAGGAVISYETNPWLVFLRAE